jgi:hypothetical protein
MSFLRSELVPGQQPATRKSAMKIREVASVTDSEKVMVDANGVAQEITLANLLTSLGVLASGAGDFATAAQGVLADDALSRSVG